MTWLCSCTLLNSGLNNQCAATKSDTSEDKHYRISSNTPDFHTSLAVGRETRYIMNDSEELFSKFYNHQRVLICDMDMDSLREHRDELSKIAFEAKARLRAAEDEVRERAAKSGKKEWLVNTDTNQSTSDAIRDIKVRKDRMSKIDKIRQQLLSAGIDDATVKEMVTNMERKATEKNLKLITFNGPSIKTTDTHTTQPPESIIPFNPDLLKFGE